MTSHTFAPPQSASPQRRGRKATTGLHDLNIIFHQVNAFQDLLRFEHDSQDIDPAVSVIQEYARAIRLNYIRTRWSRLGLTDWHCELQSLLSARSSMLMGLNVWDPLDDFLDTYSFEMEIQPQAELDARGRKAVKRGLLKQLQEIAARELENCHKTLCDLLEGKLSNWRTLDSKLLTFKKKVWLDCEEAGGLRLATISEVALSPVSTSFATPSNTSSIGSYTPPPSEYSSSMSTENMACYPPPPMSESASSWTTESIASYTPPPSNYQLMLQPYIC